MAHRECTPEEAERWRRDYSDGYAAGRGDGRCGRAPRIGLVEIPSDLPGETGAAWVARNLAGAWAIGYSGAYRWERDHPLQSRHVLAGWPCGRPLVPAALLPS